VLVADDVVVQVLARDQREHRVPRRTGSGTCRGCARRGPPRRRPRASTAPADPVTHWRTVCPQNRADGKLVAVEIRRSGAALVGNGQLVCEVAEVVEPDGDVQLLTRAAGDEAAVLEIASTRRREHFAQLEVTRAARRLE